MLISYHLSKHPPYNLATHKDSGSTLTQGLIFINKKQVFLTHWFLCHCSKPLRAHTPAEKIHTCRAP